MSVITDWIIRLLEKETMEMNVVYDKNLEEFLRSIGEFERLQDDKVSCEVCGSVMDIESIGRIYSENNVIVYRCRDLNCVSSEPSNGDKIKQPVPSDEESLSKLRDFGEYNHQKNTTNSPSILNSDDLSQQKADD